jgi:hypothetical protein
LEELLFLMRSGGGAGLLENQSLEHPESVDGLVHGNHVAAAVKLEE